MEAFTTEITPTADVPRFSKYVVLRTLQEALCSLEHVGIKFVMETSRLLNLSPATMRDILRHAAARSIVSMSDDPTQYGDLKSMHAKLSSFAMLSSLLGHATPVTSAAVSTLHRWDKVDPNVYDSEAEGSPSVWDFSSSQPHPTQMESVLVVGLGVMGLGMATSLKEKHYVVGCDISPARLAEALNHGLSTSSDLRSTIEDATCVLFVVEKYEQVMGILDQLEEQLRSRKVPLTIVTCTTMSASSATSIQERLKELNERIQYIEAPISGGPARAAKGELLIITGGHRAVLESKLSIFQHLASRLYHAGEVGSASKAKALHQISAAMNHLSSFEIFCAGLRTGVDGKQLYEILVKDAYNQYFADRIPKFLQSNYAPDARLAIWLKDLGITKAMLEAGGVDASLVDTEMALFSQAAEKGSKEDSDICVATCWQQFCHTMPEARL
ncbi:MAG: hypothetical protein M1821_000389 [Bathelium mastoideum]|nr:MAG: hypothetical protein M1821_000389 [Bathelium mastoideum]